MNTRILIALVVALALPVAAQNTLTNLATGVTWVAAGGTSNALSTAIVEIKNHEQVAVQFQQIHSGTNVDAAGNVSIATFGVSQVPSNLVAIATVTNSVGNTASTAKHLGKNIDIGSYRYFGLISVYNGATNAVTATNKSPTGVVGTIGLQFKDKRNGL